MPPKPIAFSTLVAVAAVVAFFTFHLLRFLLPSPSDFFAILGQL